jgi:hypothetical protein
MKDSPSASMQRHSGAVLGAVAPLRAALGVFVLGACGGNSHELGFTLDPVPEAPFYTQGQGFVGRWIGEASEPLAFGAAAQPTAPGYVFPSGSSQFLLEIAPLPDATDPAQLGGTITFGAGAPPPAATDGTRGYPEGFNYDEYLSYADPTGGIRNYDDGMPPFEGFAYEVEASSFDAGVPDGVLRLMYDPRSYLASWCDLQAPHLQPDGTFAALPFAVGGVEHMADGKNRMCSAYGADDLSACPVDMAELPLEQYRQTYRACFQPGPVVYRMSCDRIFLTRFCSCTEGACSAGSPTDESRLMLRTAGNTLIGVFDRATFLNARGLSTPIGEVRFQRTDE